MGNGFKIFILLCGFLFVSTILILLVKKKINERNTLVWLAGCIVILVLSANPDIFDLLAEMAGVKYPPALLFLVSTLILLFIVLYQSIQISLLSEKVRELAQYVGVQNYKEQKKEDVLPRNYPVEEIENG